MKRLRAIKRLEMGEKEWKKYLENENMKRQEREKKKMEIPGYIEKKRYHIIGPIILFFWLLMVMFVQEIAIYFQFSN